MTKQYQKIVFRSKEKWHHIELIKNDFFGNDKGYGYFGKDKKRYDFVLEDGANNLFLIPQHYNLTLFISS